MSNNLDSELVETYADGKIKEYTNGPLPKALVWMYWLFFIFGVLALWYFWDGSHGYLDRGAWQALQELSNTTIEKPLLGPSP